MRTTFYDFCQTNGREHLLDQWDGEKNQPLTPQTVSYGSRKKVGWVCSKGHRWDAVIGSRAKYDNACPICAGKKVLAGFNDLATAAPDVAAQWHPTKNGELTPADILSGTHRKVWWQCSRGHEWEAVVKSRVAGMGCPICSNRKLLAGVNDLASLCPEQAREWNVEKNAPLTPDMFHPGSAKKVWWRCAQGHEWQATIRSRALENCRCPVCSGRKVVPGKNDLAAAFPDVAAQWLQEKNGALTPADMAANSNRVVWWVCALGHEWRTSVVQRTRANTGCPVCSGHKVLAGFNDLKTLEPLLAAQWDQELNGSVTPAMVTVGSTRRVWWTCAEGHSWRAKVYARTGANRTGCPVCAGVVRTDFAQRYQEAVRYPGKKE